MYEFITIGGGEYYVDIFNGIATIVKSGDYLNIVKISATIAFSMALLNAALSNSLYGAGKWFITTFLVTQILLFPKTTVHVTDKTNPALIGAKIDNVPFVIAYTSSTSSRVGYSLTQLFEAVFSLPDDLQYSENGMIFGVNLMQAMMQARISDSNLSTSIDSFSKNCVFFDLQFGIYSFEDLKNTDNIWEFVKSTQVENRFFTYIDKNGNTTYPSCKEGAQKLNSDWNSEFNSYKSIAFFSKKPDLTQAILSSAAPDVNQYFLNVSKTSQQILQQAMMINAIKDAVESNEAESGVQLYQNARTALQTKSTYQTLGIQAGIWVPILKIVIESIFIACFPIIALLAFIPNFTGPIIRSYLGTFFWLASFGPIYAVLHRISMGHAKTYTIGFEGVTLYNQVGIESTMGDIASMAGYMSMFVPMLAYGLAKGGAAAMSSMTTSFMSGIQSAASASVHEATTGNMSFGNVGLNSRNVSSGVSITNDAGQISHHNNDGSMSIDNTKAESHLGFDLHGSQRIENSLSNAISQEQSLGQTKSIQAQQMESKGFEKVLNNHRAIENSNGFEQNYTSEQRESFQRLNNAATDFAKDHNISKEKASEIFGRIAISGNTPKLFGMGLGGEVGGSLSQRNIDQDMLKKAQTYSEQNHLSKDFQTVRNSMQSTKFNLTDSKGESINENFSKAASLSKEAGMHFENAKRYNEQQQYINSHSFEFNDNYNNEFVHYLKDKYGSNENVLDITNPHNTDKSIRNHEIENFTRHKEQEILESSKYEDLASEYNKQSRLFANTHSPRSMMQNTHNFGFSNNTRSIDNSNIESSTSREYRDYKEAINNVNLDNKVMEEVNKKIKGN